MGYGASLLTVLAHMGGADEASVSARADGWSEAHVPDLNTIAIECRAEGRVKRFRGAPGLPDRAFESDGQLTKREIRVQTLSALDPRPHALLWDVGAGAGSVAIEWLLERAHLQLPSPSSAMRSAAPASRATPRPSACPASRCSRGPRRKRSSCCRCRTRSSSAAGSRIPA